MKFSYIPDGIDGLVLTDMEYLKELDSRLLYELDILLDRYGESELAYDFPGEWKDAWKRETREIVEFCNSGKMIVFLTSEREEDCELVFSALQSRPMSFIDIRSGKMMLLNAGELIQCLSYPSLEMTTILDISLEPGTYLLAHEGIANIRLEKVENISDLAANNVIFPA